MSARLIALALLAAACFILARRRRPFVTTLPERPKAIPLDVMEPLPVDPYLVSITSHPFRSFGTACSRCGTLVAGLHFCNNRTFTA